MQEIKSYRTSIDRGDVLAQGFMSKVYLWMTFGLCATGAVSYYVAHSAAMLNLLFGNGIAPIMVLFVVEIGIVIYLSARVMTLNPTTASALFFIYAALNGLTIAPIFLVYTRESLSSAFFVTAGMFGVMSLYGTVTKRDLTSWGDFLMMGLIGVIIASVVNMFLKNETVMWVTTIIGVIVFVGLTAYDTQKLRKIARETSLSEDVRSNLSVMGALTLYLDFINLFLLMLRFMRRR